MRIVVVWAIALFLLFTITMGWYISLPIAISLSRVAYEQASTIPAAIGVIKIIEFICYIWGGVFDLFIILWAVFSSQKHDVESTMYG